MEHCLLKHNQFSLKKKLENVLRDVPFLSELEFNQKGSSHNSRKRDTCELPQTHRRELSPNLHCLYHTFPQILTDNGLSTLLFQNNFKLKLRTIN